MSKRMRFKKWRKTNEGVHWKCHMHSHVFQLNFFSTRYQNDLTTTNNKTKSILTFYSVFFFFLGGKMFTNNPLCKKPSIFIESIRIGEVSFDYHETYAIWTAVYQFNRNKLTVYIFVVTHTQHIQLHLLGSFFQFNS